jgi:hypothetical protein
MHPGGQAAAQAVKELIGSAPAGRMLRRPATRSITATWYCPGERSGGRLAAAIQQAGDERTAEAAADQR